MRSEAYLHILADSIPAIAWSATPDGHFDYFNQRMIDFTGLPDDQSGTAFHPEDWKKASARVAALAQDRRDLRGRASPVPP